MTGYINEFNNNKYKTNNKNKNKNTITMSLKVKGKQVLKNYNKIWKKNWNYKEYRFWQQTYLWW